MSAGVQPSSTTRPGRGTGIRRSSRGCRPQSVLLGLSRRLLLSRDNL